MTQPQSYPLPTSAPTMPEASYPMLVHVVTDPIFPPKVDSTGRSLPDEPTHWALSKEHPFVPGFRVLRMFLDEDGLVVYSIGPDNKSGMRDLVMARVRLAQEAMPVDVLIEEIEDAEGEDDDPPGEPDAPQEPGQSTPAPQPAPNGQPS